MFSKKYTQAIAKLDEVTMAANATIDEDCIGDMISALDADKRAYGDDNDDIRYAYKQMIAGQIAFLHQSAINAIKGW